MRITRRPGARCGDLRLGYVAVYDLSGHERTVREEHGADEARRWIWKTAAAVPIRFQIYVPDPVVEEVGFPGVMEGGKPIQPGLHLKLIDGKISGAEDLIARDPRDMSLGPVCSLLLRRPSAFHASSC